MEGKRRWQDGIGLLLGIWLCVMAHFGSGPVRGVSTWDGYLFGAVILGRSALALARSRRGDGRIGMFIGLWLIAAPFVLGFASDHTASLSHIGIGLLVVVDAMMAASGPAPHAHRA